MDEILAEAKRLVSLLEDPHPGLFTWNMMLCERGKSLRDKLLVALPLETPTTGAGEGE